MNANEYAKNAAALLDDRGKDRDQPDGERSMARCVHAFNAMTKHDLSVEDGWLFMVYLKHARMRGGNYRRDDYEDAVSYEALMAEEAEWMSDDSSFSADASVSQEQLDEVFWYNTYYTTLRELLDTEVKNR